MKSRQVLKLQAKDYVEAKRALEAVEEQLEEKGREAKDIYISFRKEDTHPEKSN